MIWIFSNARSGSTWLAKIFDSHPDVCYLHEPEIVDRGLDLLPFWFDHEPVSADLDASKIYLSRLIAIRSPRTVGSRPFFRKSYRSPGVESLRRGLIYAAKGAERLGIGPLDRVRIPDMADRGSPRETVLKSVSGLGRAEVLIRCAEGRIRPILLMRHPCGYVGSMLRGRKLGTMGDFPGLGALLGTRAARRLGAGPSTIDAGNPVAVLAWNWLLGYAEAYPAIRASGEIVIYEDLLADPRAELTRLFERVGLNWTQETDDFLASTGTRKGGYYSVYRAPGQVSDRWRRDLGEEGVETVRTIVMRDPIGQMFFVAPASNDGPSSA